MVAVAGCAAKRQEPQAPAATLLPLYAAYKIGASEGDSLATCMLQFFSGKHHTQTLWLEAPAAVSVDGQVLEGDSAQLTGVYYEYQQPLSGFGGRHTIAYRHTDGGVAAEPFDFPVFTLAALPDRLPAADIQLFLKGLADGTTVRVVLSDTSLAGEGVNEHQQVHNGAITLTGAQLGLLKRGPVVLHLSAEMERPLSGALPGSLSVSYSLTRGFALQ